MAAEVAGAETVAPEAPVAPAEAPVAETKPATPVTAAVTTAKAAASTAAAAATSAAASTSTAVKTAAAAVDGAVVFAQKCASCHGMKAEKAALGKSQVIAGWDQQQTKDALKGYQAGTYGKEMKTLMQGQAKALSDAQIDALAKHISGL
ncbi:MAG: c-type cytochrome [Campylobacterales bacterium]|nr:c-type cytochrome [Campylobacterales bacterium]